MRINEIFYSLQGEGHFAGTPAVFVRFSGCNLKCGFCDTAHREGETMEIDAIIDRLKDFPAKRVILTGGEPTLQLTAGFIERLHREGYLVHVETNGTRPLPARVDWLVCSPKCGAKVEARDIDELKVVFTGREFDPEGYLDIPAREYYLQPCDVKDAARNARIVHEAVEYIKRHPRWRLSLQTHKLIDIP